MRLVLKIVIFLLIGLVVGNLIVVDYLLIKDRDRLLEIETPSKLPEETKQSSDGCNLECQKLVDTKIASATAKILVDLKTINPTPITKVINQTATVVNEPKVVVIPIASYGETASVSWVEISPSEFYFDLNNYPGAKKVTFEAYLLAEHGGSKVFARVYDKTNYRGVDYSDLQTNNENYVRQASSAISIWRGNNKYSIQLKSENGTLAKLKDAKIVIGY